MSRMVPDGAPGVEHREYARRHDHKCHERAIARNQLTFTVVEQDRSAARTVLFWIMENFDGKTPPEKLRDAFEDALAFLFSPIDKKAPD